MRPHTRPFQTRAVPLLALWMAVVLMGALPMATWAKSKSGLGKQAPDFTLSGLSTDDAVTLSALKGKVVLIDFWASWCMPCRQLMPRIAEIKTRFPDVEVIAISVDTDRDKALTFVRAVEPGLRPVHDTAQTVADAYNVERMPSSFVIDKQGLLRFRHDGYGAKSMPAIERQLQLLLNE